MYIIKKQVKEECVSHEMSKLTTGLFLHHFG